MVQQLQQATRVAATAGLTDALSAVVRERTLGAAVHAGTPGSGTHAGIDESLDGGLTQSALSLSDAEVLQLKDSIKQQLTGFGPLQPFLDDDSIEEIWINEPNLIHIARSGVAEEIPLALSETQLRLAVERMLRSTGRRLDRSNPFVDASLPDGSRLHVIIPDLTKRYWSVNIRKFPRHIMRLTELVSRGVLSQAQAEFLRAAVLAGANVLVSGATQAGKTTMLCALLAELPSTERVISVEETFEVRTLSRDWVALQTRQSNLEGVGEVTLRRLIKEALRMRPSRIVVGEVREAESLDLLIALNSGLPGICTIHANSASDAVAKLCTLPLLAGNNISSSFVDPTVGRCIDLVVHCAMRSDGTRRVDQIAEVHWDEVNRRISCREVNLGTAQAAAS